MVMIQMSLSELRDVDHACPSMEEELLGAVYSQGQMKSVRLDSSQ